METRFYLMDDAGAKRELDEGECDLLFGGPKKHFRRLLLPSLARPHLAFSLLRAGLSYASRDVQSQTLWKTRFFQEFFGIKFTGFYLVLRGGQSMEFSTQDIQVFNVILRNQYHLDESAVRGAVVIDGGANTGVFSVYAAKLGARKVYAFEPVNENAELITKNAAKNGVEGVVQVVPCALGDREFETEISYLGPGDPSGSLKMAHPYASHRLKKQKAKVVTLDGCLPAQDREKVAFIKLDVEGFEAEALKGASGTIRASKPALSFSAYHLKGDKESLPALVKSMRADYSCTLSSDAEEDFFCK